MVIIRSAGPESTKATQVSDIAACMIGPDAGGAKSQAGFADHPGERKWLQLLSDHGFALPKAGGRCAVNTRRGSRSAGGAGSCISLGQASGEPAPAFAAPNLHTAVQSEIASALD